MLIVEGPTIAAPNRYKVDKEMACQTYFSQKIELLSSVCCNIVKNKAEDIVLDEEGVAQGLQHKVLHEGLGRVLCMPL